MTETALCIFGIVLCTVAAWCLAAELAGFPAWEILLCLSSICLAITVVLTGVAVSAGLSAKGRHQT
jgi:hypothetical protein